MKKLTNRQRKALRGPNAMVQHIHRHGKEFTIGGETYIGIKVRRFRNVNHSQYPIVRA